jgi:hypothetical protein
LVAEVVVVVEVVGVMGGVEMVVVVVLLAGGGTTSDPIGAKGFGRPIVVSGIRVILESRRPINAGSEKIASLSLILFTLKRSVRKLSGTTEAPVAVVPVVSVADGVVVESAGAPPKKVGLI